MRYLVLNRARNNFGDFLIFDRGLKLIKQLKKNCEIVIADAGLPLDKQLTSSEINSLDAIIIPGGPGIRPDAYPLVYPLSTEVFESEIPVYFMGAGSKIYPYDIRNERVAFPVSVLNLFKYMNKFSPIGVRDNITMRVLEKAGIHSVVNGCPAWYSLPHLNNNYIFPDKIRQIVFSVPAGNQFVVPFLNVVEKFRRISPEISSVISFNQGLGINHSSPESLKNQYIFEQTKKMKCDICDMSGSCENTLTYDESTLHIGYRVHTHIYFLSIGKPSFLIAEDSRGAGVLETLESIGVTTHLKIPPIHYKFYNRLKTKLKYSKPQYGLDMRIAGIPNIADEVYHLVHAEADKGFLSFAEVTKTISNYYITAMKPYIEALP